MRKKINGILLLDKPIGFTSNQALQRVKHLFQAKKAGHTGSLDPIATGMLPICFGEATKFSQFLLESDKSYTVTAKLGVTTTTGDSEGDVVTEKPVDVTLDGVNAVVSQFVGEIEQTPPMYSAVKHNGQPLYKLARKGIEVERKSRRITIFSITEVELNQDELTLTVHCSKGTYIRTLVEDIANQLGCGAHVIALRRLMVSPYQEGVMYSLPTLEKIVETKGVDALQSLLLPVETSVSIFPAVKISTSAAFYLRMGQPVRASLELGAPLVRLFSEDASFLGVGEATGDGRVKPHRLLATQEKVA